VKKSVESEYQWIETQTGKPTRYFYELVQNLSDNGLRDKVSTVSPTNGQVMIFNSTTKLWTPGSN
jgi:hypothetical protein